MGYPITGYGTTITVNDGASQAQTAFSVVTKIKMPAPKVDVIEYSVLGQANTNMQKIPAMTKLGTFEFELQYNSSDLTRLYALRGLRYITGSTDVIFVITTADGTPKVYTIHGIVTMVDPGEMVNTSIPDTKVTVEVNSITIA